MKKHYSIILPLFFTVLLFNACKKYPEGPSLSFRSAKHRLVNTWKFSSANINGIEKNELPEYATQKQFWDGDGVLTITYQDPISGTGLKIDGNWSLLDNNKKVSTTLRISSGNVDSTTVYTILKLKEKELWLRSTDNSTEYHFVTSN